MVPVTCYLVLLCVLLSSLKAYKNHHIIAVMCYIYIEHLLYKCKVLNEHSKKSKQMYRDESKYGGGDKYHGKLCKNKRSETLILKKGILFIIVSQFIVSLQEISNFSHKQFIHLQNMGEAHKGVEVGG